MYVSLTVLFTCRESFDTGIANLSGPLTPDPDKHRGRKATKMVVSGGYPVRSSLLLLTCCSKTGPGTMVRSHA
jgi:hypothetical protein